ncbi:MAG: hypothetical protein A2Y14_02145 [Verrucomicrobia bacterium GWF2_51_19]|nr:MAG: hypothetical protein A2Y14_02145 [Verrucomicrobia bacterium GWF2_51_19]
MFRQANFAKNTVPLGIYVHVPFCASSCSYCAFYKVAPTRDRIALFLKTIEAELDLRPWNRAPETMYWGGGTPGSLTAQDLSNLGNCFLKRMETPPVEWTVEFSPSTVKADKLDVLQKMGVMRISMGIQSFSEKTKNTLGRQQTARQVVDAYNLIKAFPFRKNLDLIFASKNQNIDDWLQDLQQCIDLDPDSISTYCMTDESGQSTPDPDRERDFYLATWDLLEKTGYAQYEVSNFAKPGKACLHNIRTWEMAEWMGYGPSAASQMIRPACVRTKNTASLDDWASGIENRRPHFDEVVTVSNEELLLDCFIFGLRMPSGVHLDTLRARFGNVDSCLKTLQSLPESLFQNASRTALSRDGLLLADTIARLL